MKATEMHSQGNQGSEGPESLAERSTVLFRVRDRDFLTTVDTVQYFPDSYLAWLVACSMTDVEKGRPIYVDKQPSVFNRLLERTRYFKHLRIKFLYKNDNSDSSMQSSSGPPSRRAMDPCTHPVFGNRPPSTICERCGSIVDLRAKEKQGIPMALPYPTPPPLASRIPETNPSPEGQPLGHVLPNTCQMSPRSVLGQMPRNATHFGEKVNLTVVVDDLLLEVVSLLEDCVQEQQFFDKAVFILTRGEGTHGRKVIRPYVCHLYDSVSRKMIEVLRATNGTVSTRSWYEFERVYCSAFLSTEEQHAIKKGIRKLGFGCTFSDLKMDPDNFFHWRLAGDRGARVLDNEIAFRCLVISI